MRRLFVWDRRAAEGTLILVDIRLFSPRFQFRTLAPLASCSSVYDISKFSHSDFLLVFSVSTKV